MLDRQCGKVRIGDQVCAHATLDEQAAEDVRVAVTGTGVQD